MQLQIQQAIHQLEVGAGKRYLRYFLLVLLVLGVAFLYDFRAWKNFSTPEAMDSAQLARNIAEGKGYTTLFIRPLSLALVQEHNEAKSVQAAPDAVPDFARIRASHPDLANPPVYPVVLAGLMKLLPFQFSTDLKSFMWSYNGAFWRYQPDFFIAVFNELLLLGVVVLTFFIGKKLFEPRVGVLAGGLVFGCDLLWRFSGSGLSTMLLILIFLGLTWCLAEIEELAREPRARAYQILWRAAAAGALTGLGALTRYAFGWTILPVVVFLILFSGRKKALNALAAFAVFAVLLGPWVVRNVSVCGAPFGTAGFAIFAGTPLSPQSQLERALQPDLFGALSARLYWHKLMTNLGALLQNDLPTLGGSWVSILFLAGLLLGFHRLSVRRMRYFLLMCLATFLVVQALGRTQLSDESPVVNSENMLVLAVPLVFIFGAAFFFILMDQMDLPARVMRYAVIAAFVVLSCLPMLFALWYRTSPVAYPPYYPPDIQKASGWMRPEELMMSDAPWAVAWYGHRQCAWLTLDAQDDFFSLNDNLKPVSGLYLTARTLDDRLVSDCLRAGTNSWGHFALRVLTAAQLPAGFPLQHSPSGSAALETGFFLTDGDRWKIGKTTGE